MESEAAFILEPDFAFLIGSGVVGVIFIFQLFLKSDTH